MGPWNLLGFFFSLVLRTKYRVIIPDTYQNFLGDPAFFRDSASNGENKLAKSSLPKEAAASLLKELCHDFSASLSSSSFVIRVNLLPPCSLRFSIISLVFLSLSKLLSVRVSLI